MTGFDKTKYDTAWEEAKIQQRNRGEGLKRGKLATFPVADGRAVYEVTEVGETVCNVHYREDLCPDNYQSNSVDSEGRILRENLEKAVNRADFILLEQ